MSVGRRRLLGGGVTLAVRRVLAPGGGALLVALSARVPAAEPALPRRMLKLELRHVEELASTGDGRSVIVHADGRIEGGAPGDRAVDAWRSREREALRESLQSVLVLNGATAAVRVSQATPWQFLAVQWTAADGLQVAPATRWQVSGDAVQMQPRWPGPGEPVTVTVEVHQRRATAPPDGGAPPAQASSQWLTTVVLPLDTWITVARRDDTAGTPAAPHGTRVLRSGDAARSAVWVMQLRASLP